LALLAVVACLLGSWRRWNDDSVDDAYRNRIRGAAIRGATAPEDEVLLPVRDDRVLQYYAQREMTFSVTSIEAIDALPPPHGGRLYACPLSWAERNPEVVRALDGRFPRRQVGDLVIYELRRAPAASQASPEPRL
jgi:hypothetical protein